MPITSRSRLAERASVCMKKLFYFTICKWLTFQESSRREGVSVYEKAPPVSATLPLINGKNMFLYWLYVEITRLLDVYRLSIILLIHYTYIEIYCYSYIYELSKTAMLLGIDTDYLLYYLYILHTCNKIYCYS